MSGDRINILVVDDEPSVLGFCRALLEKNDFSPTCVSDVASAIDSFQSNDYEVALIDLFLSGDSGLDLVQEFKAKKPETEIVIMTGNPSLETSLEAIRHHVFSYVLKPVATEMLLQTVRTASKHYRLALENRNLIQQLQEEHSRLKRRVSQDQNTIRHLLKSRSEFVGQSESVETVRNQIAEVAPSDMTVLIRGESGTGKDVVARMISQLSGRANSNAMVKINCPAIPETLLESELFGHERGAFTGAEKRKPGRFELASGGNIFLDEIAELPVNVQVKLLQVIEHKEFCRLGETKTRRVDARILAATNAPLEEMIADKSFRVDLFYRLNDYVIVLPPLRERADDIPMLVKHFIQKHGAALGNFDLSVSRGTLGLLQRYAWPGNVRELESVVRRFVLTNSEDVIINSINGAQTASMAAATRNPSWRPPSPPPARSASPFSSDFPPSRAERDLGGSSIGHFSDKVRAAETDTLLDALEKTRWNRRQAAGLLGISYSTIRRKIAACGIKKPKSGA